MNEIAKSTSLDPRYIGTEIAPPLGGPAKRAFDIAGAAAGIIILSPLFILIALLVKLSDGGSIFYGHRRIGRGGRLFRCLKFRTMVPDGDAVMAVHFRDNPDAKAEWEATRKLKDDPRVTRVGGVLRKLSLDELPQIINILLGDMSIVGPRPVVRDELDYYGKAAVFYLKSRPGLTGLWQVSGRNDTSYRARVAMDCVYAARRNAVMDFKIMVATVPAVLLSRGSY